MSQSSLERGFEDAHAQGAPTGPVSPEAPAAAELLEGFSLWNPSSEEREDCLWRLQLHVFNVARQRGWSQRMLDVAPGGDDSWVDWNSFGRNVLLGSAATASSPDAPRGADKAAVGAAVRAAFDAAIESAMSQTAEHEKLPAESSDLAVLRAGDLLHVEKLHYDVPTTYEEGTRYFEGISTSARNFWGKKDDDYRRRIEADAAVGGLVTKLFQLPFVTEAGARYVAGAVDGKRIAMIGGGKSAQDFLEDRRFSPEKVVNIDPFLSREEVARAVKGNYRSVPLDALDPKLPEKLQAEGEGSFDEIWCAHSLPHYIDAPENFEPFFENVLAILAVGGTCRIAPLVLYGMSDRSDAHDAARRSSLLEAIAKLANDHRCNISVSGGVFDPTNEAYRSRAGEFALLTVRRIS